MGRQLVAQIFPLAWWQEWGWEGWKVGAVEFGQAAVVDQRKTDLAGLVETGRGWLVIQLWRETNLEQCQRC
jgi:hypothetical protein